MKVCYIDIKKKAAKMSLTMKEFFSYEASNIYLGPNQTKFVNHEHLKKILEINLPTDVVSKIMEDIENLSEPR